MLYSADPHAHIQAIGRDAAGRLQYRYHAEWHRVREKHRPRLFQFRDHDGNVRQVTARDVNRFLREIAGVEISLKDFRTLFAFVSVLEALAPAEPATSQRARRRQVLDAIRAAADALGNTPAICGKSCVHETVVTAFEQGTLEQFADMLRRARSTGRREKADTSSGERRGRSPAGAGMNGTRA